MDGGGMRIAHVCERRIDIEEAVMAVGKTLKLKR
jgi:hypothetical protein